MDSAKSRSSRFLLTLCFGVGLSISLAAPKAAAGNVVQPCINNPNLACILVGVFDKAQGSYWYSNGFGVGDGIPNTPVYFYINGVYQTVYHTNNSDNKGAVVIVANLGTTYGFLMGPNSNSGGRGLCNPAGQNFYSETPEVIFGSSGWVYTIGVPYSCSNG